MLTLANRLTILRILMTPVIVVLLMYRQMGAALALFLLAGVTDGLDGLVARSWKQKTALGIVLDPLADKLLLTSTVITLTILKELPRWFADSIRGAKPGREKEGMMKALLVIALVIGAWATAAAGGSIPDLKGTWAGTFKSVIFGNNPHHPGSQTIADPPRVREIKFTLDVEKQDGRVLWGKSWSNPDRKEPFAWALSEDGKTVIGADTDGYYRLTILSADRMEMCYTHSGLGPTRSIVAACTIVERVKR